MKLATQIFFCGFFIVLVLHTHPATSQEVEDEGEFNYDEKSDKGPSRWGEIRPEWSMCGHGTMQSPIDLLNKRVEVVSHLGRLKRSYKPAYATLKNRGHDMMLKVGFGERFFGFWCRPLGLKWEGGAGYIQINETQYVLKQCHWHSPSEHTLDARKFDLEVHLVHESSDGKVAVIGIMYKIGRPDSFLSSLTDHLEAITNTNEAESVAGLIDPRNIKIGSRKYYRYQGSLTTPPCTQNVSWTIVGKVRTVTQEQVKLLRVAVHDASDTNARPLQPINKRMVHLYRPSDPKDD